MGTEIEALEAKVRELTERLAHADKLACIGQMSAGIAHEINNPVAYVLANLTALSDLLEDLESTELSEAARQALTGAREMVADCAVGVDRIRRISADLKTFARVDESARQTVDVNRVVESACQMAENEVRHRARLTVQLGEVPPIVGDPGKLTQVVLNLLINAAQAVEDNDAGHHRIALETLHEGNAVVIRVSDTGRGIPEAHRARIFEPFFTTKPRDAGTGLGLWLVQEMVRRHDGEIRVQSTEGVGSTFEVRLPASSHTLRNVSPPEPAANQNASMPLRRRARVLLIDDDAALRRALRRMLSGHHEVIEADGGEEAIRMIASGAAYDAVLCDLMMPDVDGPAVYDHIASTRPELLDRLAFLSGGAFTPRAKLFLDQVEHQVVEKPVSREALLRVIAGLIERGEREDSRQIVGASK